ncbi:SIR2 family protein [uncultured Draconibacterium sp.]|uniref:SIR2 family protein n=1 Tax=uncultured Draconibacterium sp. TaxID=1573823 RepID=UPI0032602B48
MKWQFLKSDPDNVIDYIADELINSRLMIVLGSGISLALNIPSWDKLVEEMCNLAGVEYGASNDKYVLMKYCKAKLGSNYISTVKDVLYARYNPQLKEIAGNELLVALGALIIGSKRGKATNVITYNYDDVLETYLLYHGYMPNVISQVPYVKIDADVQVYHPHGYLPKYFGEDSKIVLDQDSYSDSGNILDPIYREIESAALSSTLLMIGTSGEDNNINSLLVNVKKSHISNSDVSRIVGFIFKLDSDLKDYEENAFKEKGIFCIRITDYSEIPNYISKICRKALLKFYSDSDNFLFSEIDKS